MLARCVGRKSFDCSWPYPLMGQAIDDDEPGWRHMDDAV
jgi:hypothetical protein